MMEGSYYLKYGRWQPTKQKFLRIIIVEDYTPLREALKFALKLMEFEVVADVSTGREAIRICQNLKPDLVILDYILLDTDGITTLRKIRETYDPVKSILLSASPDINQAEAEEAGFDTILSKYDAASKFLK